MEFLTTIKATFLAGLMVIGSFLGVTPEKPVDQTLGSGTTVLPIAGSVYYLAGSGVSSSATSFTLTSLTIPQSGYEIQDSDLSDTFYVTMEPGSVSRQEIVSCTTVVQNVNNTATLSGCSRGLNPISPYSATTTLQFPHAGGSKVIFSNAPQLYDDIITYIDNGLNAGASDADLTTKGLVEIATQAEIDANTATGATGAMLAISPDQLATSKYLSTEDTISTSTGTTTSASKVIKTNTGGILDPSISGNGFTPNAGETINGATLPVAVYQNKTDNEVYKSSAGASASTTGGYKFIGFAITNSTNGNAITVKTTGVVSGFTGLAEGEKYYVQDTAGTIATTTGTTEILVGVAISETELLIQKGKRFASGYLNSADSVNSVINLGFRPTIIRVKAVAMNSGPSNSSGSAGVWGNGLYSTLYWYFGQDDGSPAGSQGILGDRILYLYNSSNEDYTGGIADVTDTGFTLSVTELNAPAPSYALTWEAEGEL